MSLAVASSHGASQVQNIAFTRSNLAKRVNHFPRMLDLVSHVTSHATAGIGVDIVPTVLSPTKFSE